MFQAVGCESSEGSKRVDLFNMRIFSDKHDKELVEVSEKLLSAHPNHQP